MPDRYSKAVRSKVMSRIRSKNTRAEIILRRSIFALGGRFRTHYAKLVGNPDIVFTKAKLAVFVDGDFWHGRQWKKLRSRLHGSYWPNKIHRNIKRDMKVTISLNKSGWKVLRFWETDILNNPKTIAKRIISNVRVLRKVRN